MQKPLLKQVINKDLGKGIITIPADPELIPQGAAKDSLGFISTPGQIELCRGRLLVGAEETASGFVKGEIWGYKWNGDGVHFRKVNTKIQYYNSTTELWVDIVTGLTASAEYSFSRYQSVAGTFVYATGVDGIYKIHVANPGDYCSMYDATKNYKGYSIIGTSRMYLWNTPTDKTGLYLSYIDLQDSSVYTTVSGEATTSLSGTLAFKAGDAKRTCFAVVITLTGTGEVYTDNYYGGLTGSLGGTGTINYTTGAYTISASGVGTAAYSWEMTNNHGITDFTYSGTRTAGQGNVFRQDEGGDPIQNVEIYDGKYYSLKSRTAYELNISSQAPYADLSATNLIFRKDIGLPNWKASTVTGKGIIFMNTANLDNPQLTILQKNLNGDNLEPITLANGFDFSKYTWDNCNMITSGEFIMFSGKSFGADANDRLFLYNVMRDTVDILPYGMRTAVTNEGLLYIGDSTTDTVYNALSGFDDDEFTIENYWISSDDRFNTEVLKKVKRLRLKGLITINQILEVYVSYDNEDFELVGTIRGDGTYVELSEVYTIGSQGIGAAGLGGETDNIDGSFYFAELKLSCPKFRKRTIKLVATGIGYVSVNMIDDFNIRTFQQRLPSKYRSKQNVSLDGTLTDQ